MLIGSELEGNGVQIIDMRKLLDIDAADAPIRWNNEDDLDGHFIDALPIGSSHNVVVNEELDYGVAVGVRPRNEGCLGGLYFFSLEDPTNPEFLGCDGSDGYVHDVSLMLRGRP